MPAPGASQRRQRESYVQAGGMLRGYAPELVVRIGYITGAAALGCVLVAALLALFLPYGWPVRLVAAVVWVVPIALGLSFIVPGYRLALQDRKAEAKVVQGLLHGASEVSTSLGLGVLVVKTRAGVEQYLIAPDKLSKVPGNQVNVVVTVTPKLGHVRSVGVMGQRLMGRPEQPVPAVVKRVRLLPIVTPAALAAAAIVGVEVVAFLPIHPDIAHMAASLVAGAALVGAVYGVSQLVQRRLYDEVQTLMPGGVR